MQKLMSLMRQAIAQYDMIRDGDHIAVGLSGGKDSVALLYALAQMRSFYPSAYRLTAITIDLQFDGVPTDVSALAALCEQMDVPFLVWQTEIAAIVFGEKERKRPCSLCAKLRRGALQEAAISAGCNKLALGHHMDDAVETFWMNLLNNGTLGCFSPVNDYANEQLTIIRPLLFARESDCARVARRCDLPVLNSRCPVDGDTERAAIKEMLSSYEKKYGNVREKTLRAMQRRHIDGF